ncbi:MAG: phosphatidate cytidylyltransferase [Rectinemataceae bacterium]
MTNTTQRLLLFFAGVPALIVGIIFLPGFHHAAVSLVFIVTSGGASWELATLLQAKGFPVRKRLSALTGTLIPLVFWASTWMPHLILPGRSILLGTACLLLFILTPFAFARTDAIDRLMPEVMGLVFVILYPGLLAGYMVLIAASFPHSVVALLTFIAMTIGNDSLAWVFGVTMGKTRNIVAVSPNKSAAGFIGGLIGSVGLALAISMLAPAYFQVHPLAIAAMGLVVGCAAIVGDLFESALKRSAGVKDSGTMVPGRGGFLDSIDSLLFAAPAFYGMSLLFQLFQ